VHKVKIFFSFDTQMKSLLIEAIFLLAWARILKFFPFVKISQSLGERMVETTFHPNEQNIITIRNISMAVTTMCRYTFWESQCLVKAIAAMKMLERRKIESTLYLGTGKDPNGKLIAHAWLRSGSYYITGYEGMENFTVVATFAKKISESLQGEYYGEES
jgi:hypothetical protein